jgi:hypothetical protein
MMFGPPMAAQRQQLARAKRGRPRVGEGIQVISVSIEKQLLEFAAENGVFNQVAKPATMGCRRMPAS